MKGILFTIFSLCFGTAVCFGSSYYVDDHGGNDTNNGKSIKKAWRTLAHVNSHTFKGGDTVLFRSGGIWEGQLFPLGSGTKNKPVVFSSYGKGPLPELRANGHFKDAILLRNIQFIIVENLAASNHDTAVAYQKNGPTGVRILAENCGTIHNIKLFNLYIHNVNGDNKKGSAEGNGIFWDCEGPAPSNIENLIIENCKLERIDRNGIRGNGTFSTRTNWFPNKNLVIRNCLLQDIGGDGIVVKAFDTALVEHNKLFHIRTRAKDNAVAIWPHSSDHTTIQYNEVAYTENKNWANDGQSFDIDGNSRNTLIQYNYSHDNDGGFMLVISDAINKDNVMTTGNIIRYNLSVNDGLTRKRLFNFAGTTDSTLVEGNVFYNDSPKKYTIEIADIEGGIPHNLLFKGNLFLFAGNTTGTFTKSPHQYRFALFTGNQISGSIAGLDNLLKPNSTPPTTRAHNGEFKPVQYPWNYLPVKVKQLDLPYPDSLYQSFIKK